MITALLAFLVGFLLDVAFAKYVNAVSAGRALVAGIFSMAIGGAGIYAVINTLVNGPVPTGAYVLGLGVGTYVTVRMSHAKD